LPGSWDVLWSLSVEETFYFAYPLLCRFVRNRFVLLAIGLGLMAAGPIARAHAFNDIWYDYSYLGGMDAIAIGCVTAIVARSQWSLKIPRWVLTSVGILLLSVAWVRAIAMKLGISYNGLDVTVLAIGAALVILAITRAEASGTGKSWLSGRGTAIIRWYGRNSYEVYLTHMFVVLWGVQLFRWRHVSINVVPAWFLGILIAAGLIGAVVARFFSEPMNKWWRGRLGVVRAHRWIG